MKEVRAYIKPHKRSVVVDAINRIEGVTGLSVLHSHGRGRSHVGGDSEAVASSEFGTLEPHDRIEVVCRNEIVLDVVSAIEQAARTGLRGDGKIYVAPIEEAIRIATGERGEDAA